MAKKPHKACWCAISGTTTYRDSQTHRMRTGSMTVGCSPDKSTMRNIARKKVKMGKLKGRVRIVRVPTRVCMGRGW